MKTQTEITVATLILDSVKLPPTLIPKLRGYIGWKFKEFDKVHNHDAETGKDIYRYPLYQFKLIEGKPAVICVTVEAAMPISEMFMEMTSIKIDGVDIPIHEKNLLISKTVAGYSEKPIAYRFGSPWIGLNQRNYAEYAKTVSLGEKRSVLNRALVGNILSLAKGLGVWLNKNETIRADTALSEKPVKLKDNAMMGFTGEFEVNFHIPEYLGIGKSVSRGFGTVVKKNR